MPLNLFSRRAPRILFAQVREDPDIDRAALKIGPSDRVLTVTSGGCTALTLLSEGPAELVSVDVNPVQNHLLELKWAAVRFLSLEECRRFMGARAGGGRLSLYRFLSPRLSPAARRFWDGNARLIEKGILYSGRTETMVRWMRPLVFGLIHRPRLLRQLRRQKDLIAQARFYREVWNTRLWRNMLRLAFHPALFRFMLGPAIFKRFDTRNFSNEWIRKIDHAFADIPVQSNYFLYQMMGSHYPPGEQGLPPYLRREGYERVRRYSDRLRWVTADLRRYLSEASLGAFTKMSLSNAFEWFSEGEAARAFADVARALAPEGRAVLRHLLVVTPLSQGISLRERIGESEELTRRERAFLYSRVSVYEPVSVETPDLSRKNAGF